MHIYYHPTKSLTSLNVHSDLMKMSKARKRAAPLAQELLFGDLTNGNGNDDMSKSYTIPEGRSSLIPLARVPSAPGSLK